MVMGVLNLESTRLGAFTSHDIELLVSLAGQAAIAISKAELYRELMKAQDEIKQSETIKAVGEAVSWFVHRLGNLAFGINFPAERLKDQFDEFSPDNKDAMEDFQLLFSVATELSDIKSKLLRPLRKEIKLEPIMLADLLKDAISLSLVPKDVVSLDVASSLPLVKADREDLVDIFTELLNNAMSALKNVADKKIEVLADLYKDGDSVEVKVTDNGHGIREENLDKIWSMGFTTKEGKGGTGMGLYTCAQKIRRMNSQIFIEKSTPYQSTTFVIRIPIWGS
jgi:signal transduction histidine kinase